MKKICSTVPPQVRIGEMGINELGDVALKIYKQDSDYSA